MSFTIDDAALDRLLSSPSGPVGQDLERRARQVFVAAHADAAVNHFETGQMVDSLDYEVGGTEHGLEARIGPAVLERTDTDEVTNADVLVFVHEGTERADGTVTIGDPFLTRALDAGR